MKLEVSQEAIDALKDVLKEKNSDSKAVRVTVAGYG
jgi:Fe-S cluster assembly iron-binding protein IscA